MIDNTTTTACGIDLAFSVLDGKWTLEVLRELVHHSPVRFNGLRRAVPGASSKTLTERLRRLETQGIIERTVYAEVPPHVEYTMTAKGQSFQIVLNAMLAWGEQLAACEQLGDPPTDVHHRRAANATV